MSGPSFKVPQQDKVAGFHNLIAVLNLARQSPQGRPITKGHGNHKPKRSSLTPPLTPYHQRPWRDGGAAVAAARARREGKGVEAKQAARHGARLLQP